jgi:hypothetical protein
MMLFRKPSKVRVPRVPRAPRPSIELHVLLSSSTCLLRLRGSSEFSVAPTLRLFRRSTGKRQAPQQPPCVKQPPACYRRPTSDSFSTFSISSIDHCLLFFILPYHLLLSICNIKPSASLGLYAIANT